MILLAASTEKLQVVLGGAVTTNQLQWTASYMRTADAIFERYGTAEGVTNSTTDVDLLTGVTDKQISLRSLSVYNADTADSVVTIKKDVSGTEYIIVKATLASGQSMYYSKDSGWNVSGLYVPIKSICLHADGGANLTLTNSPLAERFLGGVNRILEADFTGCTLIRLRTVVITGSASAGTPLYRIRYYTSYNTTFANYLQLGASAQVEVSLTNVGRLDTGWLSLATGARGPVFLAECELGGDGVIDPALGYTELMAR